MEKPTSPQSTFWLPIVVALVAGSMYVVGQYVQTRMHVGTTISVSGEGRVFASPDIASLSFGIQTDRQKTAQAATKILQESMNDIIAAVKEQGIEEKDIQTQYLNLNPAFDWNDGTRIPRGFEAVQNLLVKIRDLDKVGDVLSAATSAGANQVGGVQFTIDDPDQLRAEARAEAIKEAQEKAKQLAKDLGVRLGKLQGFYEGGNNQVPYMERAMMEGGYGGGHVIETLPIPAGQQELRINVSLTYAVK